ncbi:unnamed protein product [Urochloa decumbens]|uniref:F-box domain-containing protein n=1 Tax=Urochloa decumbens TaxID=240449 RepID=A0ABC9BYH3_9POAL
MDTSNRRCRCRCKSFSSSSAPSEYRDWAALPHDVLFDVFLRLESCEIMWGAEGVCKAWRRVVVEEPKLWRRIHITSVPEWSSVDIAVRDAVDRSAGLCEAFSGPWDDDSLLYLAERSPSLKEMHLSHDEYASYEVLIEAIKKLPLLEDLEISPPYQQICASERFFESVCKARPLLKNIKIMFTMPSGYNMGDAVLEEYIDGDIYRTPLMLELRSLELSNYLFFAEALTAILDNCPLLESLKISGLLVDGMDVQLREKCARIKNLSLPNDSDEEDEETHDSDEEDEEPEDEDEVSEEDEDPSDTGF